MKLCSPHLFSGSSSLSLLWLQLCSALFASTLTFFLRLSAWLAGWVGGWVVGWVGGWLVGWLVGWWTIGWLVDCLPATLLLFRSYVCLLLLFLLILSVSYFVCLIICLLIFKPQYRARSFILDVKQGGVVLPSLQLSWLLDMYILNSYSTDFAYTTV